MIDIKERLGFIQSYISAPNAAEGSAVDSNANVTHKTMATLEAELSKPMMIKLNRGRLKNYMSDDTYKDYLADLDNHLIYTHDETSLKPYCASISLYPFLLEGTKCIGGVSDAPKNLQSFCGSFVNFVYQVASSFAGAIATVEFLHYFDYFARKTYGTFYLTTHEEEIKQELQGVVYALNQPASARGDQSVFWNISVFDKGYFEAMFGNFYYPDDTQPNYESVSALQRFFMEWFHEERSKELLTFPVLTASHLIDPETKQYLDKDFKDFCTHMMSKGFSFFVYVSDSADSLASCCRLRNELADNTFSYSLGAGGLVTGSAQVITINMFRLFKQDLQLEDVVKRVHKYLYAHKLMFADYIEAGLLPPYTAGIMDLDKQFLTVGLNGVVEAAEELGFTVGTNSAYKDFLRDTLGLIKHLNTKARSVYKDTRFNTEFVPAENLGVKFAKWDKETFGYSLSDCYNSYFYRVEGDDSIIDRAELYADDVTKYLDGGSALHLNLGQLMSKQQANTLYDIIAGLGVPYWTYNVLSTCCNKCGFINQDTMPYCTKCGSTDVDYATRVIGYLKRVSSFSLDRQKEAGKRFYNKYTSQEV